MEINERIKNRRKEIGLSADEVANALHVSRATIYRYESKEIEKLPTNIIEPLAKVLNYLIKLSQSLPPDQLERLISYAKFLKTEKDNN